MTRRRMILRIAFFVAEALVVGGMVFFFIFPSNDPFFGFLFTSGMGLLPLFSFLVMKTDLKLAIWGVATTAFLFIYFPFLAPRHF